MTKTYLVHHGIKGQRWGVRRYQNDDGTLTPLGRKKYDVNADGTVNIKDSYRKSNNRMGLAKTAIGAGLAAKGVSKIVKSNKFWLDKTSKGYKADLNKAIFSMTLGAIVVGSGVKNFINSHSNRTFNSTGMGPTPETFTGKAKTAKQVLAAQNREKNKK